MNQILILDDTTINKIAAGEVVERPASIIKELVENAIDADSTAITVEIRDGGTSYIRVTDNGNGMSPQDARISFERHATSKINSSIDLENIHTLGFRGEALASIAAVTHMEMITRQRESISGAQIINHGGNIVSEKEIGCPEGTTIIAQNLFFNTPARLKFLKSPRTETAYISDLIGKLILAHPEISFKYMNNGKIVYYSSGDGDLKNAILSVYGKDVVNEILPITPVDTSTDIKLSGYLGKPSLGRRNRSHQSFYVNGRYVKSSLLAETVEDAYKPYLAINLFPWIILHIGIAPNMVDVNVHPAKTQVRFRQGEKISNIIQSHIGTILKENPYIPTLRQSSYKSSSASQNVDVDKEEEQIEVFSSISSYEEQDQRHLGTGYTALQEGSSGNIYTANISNISFPKEEKVNKNNMDKGSMNENEHDNNRTRGVPIPLKIVGKIFATYIVVEGEKECLLIDQHAAHERLLFEKYKKMISEQAIVTQQLLPPAIIEVTHAEQLIIEDCIDLFHSLGFEIEAFGGKSFAVRGVPVILGTSHIKEFFQELLDNAEHFSQGSNYKLKIDDIIQMSCKKAVKAGDSLSDKEILALLNDLMNKKIPMTCPHGRPIMISISQNQLEKMFRRI